jgi:hypothetical protein
VWDALVRAWNAGEMECEGLEVKPFKELGERDLRTLRRWLATMVEANTSTTLGELSLSSWGLHAREEAACAARAALSKVPCAAH